MPAGRRPLALLTSLAMAALIPGWLVVGIIGLGAFERVPEQAGCYQPEVAYGVALLGLAVLGLLVACWTLRHAVPVARGRRHDQRYLLGVGITGALVAAFVVVAVPLNPDSRFGAC
jgi:hypothetical protein